MYRRILTATGYLLLMLSAGCQCSSDIRPDAPPRIALAVHERPSGRSTVFIPIEIPISEVGALVNDAVPDSLYSARDERIRGGIFPIKMDIDIRRDGPIRTRTYKGSIENRVPIRASGRVRLPPGIWRPFETTLTIRSVTSLTLNEDWATEAETTGDFRWQEPPYITLVGIKIGLAGKAENALRDQLVKVAPKIDKIIEEQVNLRKEADKIWDSIGDPIQIRSEPPAWLMIRPVGTYFRQAVSEPDTFMVGLSVEAEFETVLGQRPPDVPQDTLPPLVPFPDSLSDRNLGDFQMHVPVTITYDEAKKLFFQSLGGRPLAVDDNVTVTIHSVDLYANGAAVIARLDFQAKIAQSLMGVEGTVYLRGVPAYDPVSRTASIDSLDYDLNSRDALAHAADWFFHGTFLDQTREQLRFPIGAEIDRVSDEISKVLTDRALGKHIVLNGVVSDITPGGIYLTEDGINVDVFVRGTMAARIRRLGEVVKN